MSSYQTVNGLLWDAVNWMGWGLWGSVAVLGGVNLYLMSKLTAPKTIMGRWARVINTIGFWLLVISPLMNVAGCIALPLLVVGYTVVHMQLAEMCRIKAAASTEEPRPTVVGQAVRALVEPRNL